VALVDRIINAIKEIENYRFDKEVAELLDIDNKALATYKSRGELPQYYIRFFCRRYNIDLKNLDNFLSNIDNYNKNITGIKQSGDVVKKQKDKEMDYIVEAQQETIKLQQEKIKRLEENNSQLKQNVYSVQSKKWDELSCDFYSDVYVTFVPFKRVVKEMSGHGVEQLSEMLEIDKDILLKKYFAVNEWHNFNEHPVNDIIEPNTLKELQEQSVQMPSLFESLKLLVGEHYFQQLITYKHNDKLVHSLCNIRIHWLNKPHRAECKTQFILSQ